MKTFQQSSSQPIRSVRSFAIRCVWQWLPQLLALAGTASVIAIVISGSLGVGDSIQQCLRQMANQRLGGIITAVIGSEPFGKQFSERLNESFQQRLDVDSAGCEADPLAAVATRD